MCIRDSPWTNRVSAIVAELPTDHDDPIGRVERCREAMEEAKRQFELVPAEAMMEATQVTSPVIAASALRLVNRLRLADRVNMPVTVVISNGPGPREPRFFGGAQLEQYIPVSTIADGVGLNITVHSYLDRLDFGLVADRELVPDLWDMMDLHMAEIDRLFEAAGIERPAAAPADAETTDGTPAPKQSKKASKQAAGRSTKKAAGKSGKSGATAARKRSAAKTAAKKRANARRRADELAASS